MDQVNYLFFLVSCVVVSEIMLILIGYPQQVGRRGVGLLWVEVVSFERLELMHSNLVSSGLQSGTSF